MLFGTEEADENHAGNDDEKVDQRQKPKARSINVDEQLSNEQVTLLHS
jgi:hypothetical protein